jgi:hypothetical protein
MRHPRTKLRKTIIATTMELIDCGGTTPWQTYEFLLDEQPELCKHFDEDEVIDLCEEIQKGDLPVESYRFQELFRTFNVLYFGGRLTPHKVQVVYDVNRWSDEYYFNGIGLEEFSSGYIDIPKRRIFIRRSESNMEGYLAHEMGHAATSGDHDDAWYAEMRRLQELGAPVLPWDTYRYFPPSDGPLQLTLDLTTVRTAEEIFGQRTM